MEPEGLLPGLKVPATCPYSEPDQSSPYSIPLPEELFEYYHTIYSLRFPHQNPVRNSPLPHTCYVPRSYHSY